jgi:HEAT repeat protein
MKTSPRHEDHSFDEIREALLDEKTPFPAALLFFFSDISAEDLRRLEKVWPEVQTQRRRGLLEDMENMAEADTLLFFDDLAVMALEDPDPIARATAIRLLWQTQDEDLAPRLIELLEDDPEAIVRAAAATALGIFVYYGELEEIEDETHQRIVKALRGTYLSSDDILVRRRALEALGYSSHPDVPGFIREAYQTHQEEWLQSALFAMGRSYDERWTEAILESLDHPDNLVRYEAVRAAGELEMEKARQPLFDLLAEGTDDVDLYYAAIWSLTKIGGEGVRRLIQENLEEAEDPDEIQFLEEALENLNFNEEFNFFGMMDVDDMEPNHFWGPYEDDLPEEGDGD